MARPREFDEAEVIRLAADVFWQKGYQDAALPDLLAGMKLTRGSLYKAFGEKKRSICGYWSTTRRQLLMWQWLG